MVLAEIAAIRQELSVLGSRLDRVVEQIRSTEFELVDSVGTTGTAGVYPTSGEEQRPIAGGSPPPLSPPSSSDNFEGERVAAARETGQFFRRCLAGLPRGISGQGRIRLYVVVRDFSGRVSANPVVVFHSWADTKYRVSDHTSGEYGDSIFAGFASQWEAKAAVREAGYTWPAEASR